MHLYHLTCTTSELFLFHFLTSKIRYISWKKEIVQQVKVFSYIRPTKVLSLLPASNMLFGAQPGLKLEHGNGCTLSPKIKKNICTLFLA